MMEVDRKVGESVSLVIEGHVIQVALVKAEANRARIAIEAPIGTMMYRNERLSKPLESVVVIEQTSETAV